MEVKGLLIYCVEDDESIRGLVTYALKGQGYEVRGFSEAAPFYKALEQNLPDLILLDIMLPGEDGIKVLKKLKNHEQTRDIPVIMATAKSSEYDVVKGLDSGADDYMTKPFGIMELLSRIRSVLRRSRGRNAEPVESRVINYGKITVIPEQHIVKVDGKEINLTLKEFELLKYLMINKNMVLSRDQIMQVVWEEPFSLESRTIDMHIMSLRQKLGEEGKHVCTVRGIGYRLGRKNKRINYEETNSAQSFFHGTGCCAGVISDVGCTLLSGNAAATDSRAGDDYLCGIPRIE